MKISIAGSRSYGAAEGCKNEAAMLLMIVDDNARMRRVIRRICRDFADHFCECADGAEALATYRAQIGLHKETRYEITFDHSWRRPESPPSNLYGMPDVDWPVIGNANA